MRIKHKIELKLISFRDGIIKFNFKIESPAIDTRHMHLNGSIDIWGTGIVKYEIYGDQSDEYAIAVEMHKIIIDLFHQHQHRMLELSLPLVEANGLE